MKQDQRYILYKVILSYHLILQESNESLSWLNYLLKVTQLVNESRDGTHIAFGVRFFFIEKTQKDHV